MNDSSCIFEIIDQTIKTCQTSLSVKELCQVAGVSRSGLLWSSVFVTLMAKKICF